MPQAKGVMSRTQALRLIGFTLAEILVALALIALLAAVLLPTVAGQILKGDAARVQQDLEAIRGGVEQFLADVHRYPGKYSDLSTKISTVTGSPTFHLDINGAGYPQGLVNKWSGPYVTKDTQNAVIETGYGAIMLNGFVKTQNTNLIDYLTVRIAGIAQADYDKLDAQIDGTSTACPACRSNGLLRLTTGDTTRFLAIPIQ